MKLRSKRVIFGIGLLVVLYAIGAYESEVAGCDFPPMTLWYRTYMDSWQPGSTVHVFIDSRFNDATVRAQLAQGFLNWSLWSEADCSGVTFYGFDTMDMSGLDEMISRQPTPFG
ncbi:MAG TPA: hypothetical protein VNG71_02685 [Pyrinomonadaceae bacterium]|nr:hypothetical protein [Pyrinomonadaceae bacterium]